LNQQFSAPSKVPPVALGPPRYAMARRAKKRT